MSYKRFPNPVRVILRSRQAIITTTWEAVEFLRTWPGKRGPEYRRALRRCLDALDGIISPKKAYTSFAQAARQAGILA